MQPIRFIHISDTHIGPTKEFNLHGVATYKAFQQVLAALQKLPFQPDFIVHTGDIATDPDPHSYRLYASMIEHIDIPFYYVTGNHDDAAMIHSYLTMEEKIDMDQSKDENMYHFSRGDSHFLTIDARGPRDIDPHGQLTDIQFEQIARFFDHTEGRVTIFIHFPLLPLDAVWLDRDMLLLEGEKLHHVFVAHRERIAGVFFGHVHRGMQVMRDGVLYSSVGSTCLQFPAFSPQEQPRFESTGCGYFNIVTLDERGIVVKEHSVANGSEQFVK